MADASGSASGRSHASSWEGGASTGNSSPGADASTGSSSSRASASADPACDPGRSPLRRLSLSEYLATVHDLLGVDTSTLARTFPPDQLLPTLGTSFSNDADSLTLSETLAVAYRKTAETSAAAAAANLAPILPCAAALIATGAAADACATQFVASFGRRAFRRPLTPLETQSYFNLYAAGSTPPEGGNFADGVSLAIEAFLQSPNFLYRVERGAPTAANATVAPVTDFEMATRLSYFFWGTGPDDALLDVAQANQLHTPAQIAATATQMLRDPRAKAAVSQFHDEWLVLPAIQSSPKDATLFPTWTPAIAADMVTEAETFVDHVFWTDGRSDTLLSASYTYVNKELATFYGLTPPSVDGFVQVSEDPTRRAGILTLGGILAYNATGNQTNPVHRGRFVREQLLCQPLPPPPPHDLKSSPPLPPATATTRQRFEQHASDPTCAPCHVPMDGIGFGLEHYDPVGNWRETDRGLPIDDSGQVAGLPTDINGPFKGAIELASKLAKSEKVRQCVAKQWFRFASGRREVLPVDAMGQPMDAAGSDACTLASLYKSFEDSGHDMRDLRLKIALSDAFRYRSLQGGGP
jgi:hypothetical protein